MYPSEEYFNILIKFYLVLYDDKGNKMKQGENDHFQGPRFPTVKTTRSFTL